MKKFILKILPIVAITAVTALIFFKIFTKGLYPIPADLLVSFYFPWYSGDWQGYSLWTTHKEMLGADSIRQIYVWKEFAAEELKNKRLPLWNPYTFSGQPLAANFQSSVWYPFNIFYVFTDAKNAWILLVVIQPLLGGLFMYLAIRSFNVSKIASMFGSTAFMFSSYLITWMENGNISHSYIWLPLAIWSMNKYFFKEKFRYFTILSLSLALSILGGHPQTAIYLYMTIFVYWVYKMMTVKVDKKKSILTLLAISVLSFLVSAIQIIPTYYFYKISPISLPFSQDVFERSILPLKNLITFFASDFFGHPANNNFWSQTYGDFTPYFGVIPLIFALWAGIKLWRRNEVKFFVITSIIFIIAAIHSPITFLIKVLEIPLLNSTTPSRFIAISIFFLIILTALGFQDFLENIKNRKYQKHFFKFLVGIGIIYGAMWLFAIFGILFLEPKDTWQINLSVTRRNLIIPTVMFITIPFGILATMMFTEKLKISTKTATIIFLVGFFTVTLFGGVYYTNKFLPVAPKSFIFPDHPLFYWLNHKSGLDRFYGGETAHIDFNFPTHYEVYGIEGYDTLRLKRYAELLASTTDGKVPPSYLRSDGVVPNIENGYRKRIFELLGVKYLLDKEDYPKTGADWHYERFQNDKIEGFWQYNKFQVYKREPTLPRIFLTTKYIVEKSDEKIIEKIYDPKFNLKTLILEKDPPLPITNNNEEIIIPNVVLYQPDEVIITTNQNYNSLLYLSDAYDSDWKVYIDNTESEILRTDYALRSVAVPQGEHRIIFRYEPKSFTQGLYVTSGSIIGLVLVSLYFIKKRRF